VLAVDGIYVPCMEPGKMKARMRGREVCMKKVDWEECGLEGGELGPGEYAVCGCTCDERLEDFGTEEGAVGEDMVGCWGEYF
jgi:hypothetical protein